MIKVMQEEKKNCSLVTCWYLLVRVLQRSAGRFRVDLAQTLGGICGPASAMGTVEAMHGYGIFHGNI